MSMRYEDFWYNYDLREFWNAVEGFYKAESRRLREGWEQTRIIISFIANKPTYGVKQRSQEPKKLLPLPWDDEAAEIEKEVIDSVKKRIEDLNNGIKYNS